MLISQVDDTLTRSPLVIHIPCPSTTFHYLGPCAYPGHINTVPSCTIYLKLVLFTASNSILLSLLAPRKDFRLRLLCHKYLHRL